MLPFCVLQHPISPPAEGVQVSGRADQLL